MFKTRNNIQSGDDVVGQQNLLSAYVQPDLYFGQYPLSFAVSQGQKEVLESLKKFQSGEGQQAGGGTSEKEKDQEKEERKKKDQKEYQKWLRKNRSVRWGKAAGCCDVNCSQIFCSCCHSDDDGQTRTQSTGLRKYKELYPQSLYELKKSEKAFRDDTRKGKERGGGKPPSDMEIWDIYGSWEMLVNMQDELGNTPLHIAVMHKKTEM